MSQLTPNERGRIFDRDGPFCRYCGLSGEIKVADKVYVVTNKDTGEPLCIDHIIPSSKGGSYKPGNLQVLCRTCNSMKGALLESELIGVLMKRNLVLQFENQALRNRLRGY